MSSFEDKFVHNSPNSEDIATWLPYVDDVFMLWKGTYEQLMEFMTYLNSSHERIEFTINHSIDSIQYLDVEIYREGYPLQTKLYKKPSDRNNTLQCNSYHAPKVFGGIPKGEFTRARRICTKDTDFQNTKKKIINKFVERGYNKHQVERTGKEVAHTQTQEIKNKKQLKRHKNELCILQLMINMQS